MRRDMETSEDFLQTPQDLRLLMAHFDLGDNQPLWAVGEAHHHVLAGLQVFQARPAQGLDVDEDVAGMAFADHKAIALGPVEPLDLGQFEGATRRGRGSACWAMLAMSRKACSRAG